MSWHDLDNAALGTLAEGFAADHALLARNPMGLDLTRGKPAPDQLDLSNGLDGALNGNYFASDGTDTRNYGGYRGIPEIRDLGATLMDTSPERVLAAGNSSLNLMFLGVELCMNQGLWGDQRCWRRAGTPTALFPVPGYDRHFTVNDTLGLAMETVPMTDTGPDMDAVETLARSNADLKSLWCVPKYSNPTGVIYSDDTVQRIAQLPALAAADDFVVFWDNAYAVHDFEFPTAPMRSIMTDAEAAGTADHVLMFASTSKITFAGAGVGFLGATQRVLDVFEQRMSTFIVGYDKVNQLRHARFLNDRLEAHMADHAALVKPKFDAVESILTEELGDPQIATWTRPKGGYFVSLDCLPGLASRIIELASDAGLKVTPAGATFPYGRDPEDKNIRIAPTYAALEDVKSATRVLALCIKLATSQALSKRS